MDLRAVYPVPAFSQVYTKSEIPRNFRILRIPENEQESVETSRDERSERHKTDRKRTEGC